MRGTPILSLAFWACMLAAMQAHENSIYFDRIEPSSIHPYACRCLPPAKGSLAYCCTYAELRAIQASSVQLKAVLRQMNQAHTTQEPVTPKQSIPFSAIEPLLNTPELRQITHEKDEEALFAKLQEGLKNLATLSYEEYINKADRFESDVRLAPKNQHFALLRDITKITWILLWQAENKVRGLNEQKAHSFFSGNVHEVADHCVQALKTMRIECISDLLSKHADCSCRSMQPSETCALKEGWLHALQPVLGVVALVSICCALFKSKLLF